VIVLCAALVSSGCAGGGKGAAAPSTSRPKAGPGTSTSTSTTSTTAPPPPAVLLAAGDIATCPGQDDEATADLLAAQLTEHPDAVIAAVGDLAYERGTTADFKQCFAPSWGRFHDRIRPAAGNHEYGTGVATGYFDEWGDRAGPAGKGWYSYDLGAWHVVVLNSNCDVPSVGGCGPDSEQGKWLAADLAAHANRCSLAYWHHPRWSSGLHGSQPAVDPFWQAMVAAHVDVVVNGHDHHYERFAPVSGVREFVVGTGGAPRYPVAGPEANSEVRHSGTPGVLRLTLHAASYDWRFLAAADGAFTDEGSTPCT
jgi:alkaline phosphatase